MSDGIERVETLWRYRYEEEHFTHTNWYSDYWALARGWQLGVLESQTVTYAEPVETEAPDPATNPNRYPRTPSTGKEPDSHE